ncbi:MAG TPA: PDZ domain-containing protein [Pyrinomonadaceae bacterium]|nr:PDZ domain-containing protein [Pyrinomonadaceae bacterium]
MAMRIAAIMSLVLCCAVTMAQVPAPSPAQPAAPPSPVDASVNVPADKKQTAPQVVTIVHRLNGLKMFRLLVRSEEEAQAISRLGSTFSLLDEVHTNVIAGLAMDDGETIAAWLPDADVEFGTSGFSAFAPWTPGGVPAAPPVPTAPGVPAVPAPASPFAGFGRFFEPPDVTVIGADGKPLIAKYVGLDAVTGLSILRLANKNVSESGAIKDEPVGVGESVRLFGPEPVTGQRGMLSAGLYVRIGATDGKVLTVQRAPSGEVARFKVSSPRLSQSIVGGVALNEAGETVGIVDALEAGEASVLSTDMIRRAARRVLERQASVPRPWLGVQGEAVAGLKVDQMLVHGWKLERAAALAEEHRGILVNSIIPDSPAAQAALRVGDVILKFNNQEISNAQDFTWFLEQAGPSSNVSFTIARPDRVVVEALDVKLTGMPNPKEILRSRSRARGDSERFSLIDQGIETIALRAPVATQLGTTAGLLVIYVEPSTAAFAAGLQPGDVIKSINGRTVSLRRPFLARQPITLTFEIVRNKEKHTVVIKPAKKKQ